MANYGGKVSKIGSNTSSADPKDYVFHSKYSTVKIAQEISGTVVVAGSGSTSKTIEHDLGFIPMVLMFFEPITGSGDWTFGCGGYSGDDTYISNVTTDTYVDNLDVVFKVFNNTGSEKTVKYHCYIMGDPI